VDGRANLVAWRATVKVHPRARRTGVGGRFGAAWKVDLGPSLVDGRANLRAEVAWRASR